MSTRPRIKSTIRLYSYINKKDYRGVLIHVVYLLYAPVTKLHIGDDVFHRFTVHNCGCFMTRVQVGILKNKGSTFNQREVEPYFFVHL